MMTQAEKAQMEDLINISWQKQLGSFYIRSTVLKVTSNYLVKLDPGKITNSKNKFNSAVLLAERYLMENITGRFPSLNELIVKLPISASTLNRHFKARFGMTMTDYFYMKKIFYAKQLISEQDISMEETAAMVGYRNTKYFRSMLNRYDHSQFDDQPP